MDNLLCIICNGDGGYDEGSEINQLLEKLTEYGHDIKSQDNRATGNPIFEVQRPRLDYHESGGYFDAESLFRPVDEYHTNPDVPYNESCVVWRCDCETVFFPDDREFQILEAKYQGEEYLHLLTENEVEEGSWDFDLDEMDYERGGMVFRWEPCQPFFTETEARIYIADNSHNLATWISNHYVMPRIYVESGYRNDQWQTMRAFLAWLADADKKE